MTLMLVALVAGVVALTVVQVAVYYYLLGGGRATANGPEGGQGGPDNSPRVGAASEDHGTDPVRTCPDCGAPNDAEAIYTFCRHCGAELS